MKINRTTNLEIRLRPEEKIKLKKIAESKGRSLSEFVRSTLFRVAKIKV